MIAALILAASVVSDAPQTGDVDAIVRIICDESLDRNKVRRPTIKSLAATDAELSTSHLKQLIELLPGAVDGFTIELIELLGKKGDVQALDALIKYSTEYRVGKLVISYVVAIEALETRLEMRRKIHPIFRREVEKIREQRRKERGQQAGDEVRSLVAVICGNMDVEDREEAVRSLSRSQEALTEQQVRRLVTVLPGEQDIFTGELVLLLGQRGNEEALDALIKYSTKQRVFRMMVNYAVAIEMLETRLQVTRKLDPNVRLRVDKIRARKQSHEGSKG